MVLPRLLLRSHGLLSLNPRGGSGRILVGRVLSSSAPMKHDMTLIRELREASGAPIVDCKNALAVRRTQLFT